MIGSKKIWPQVKQISVEEELKNIIAFIDAGMNFIAVVGSLLS